MRSVSLYDPKIYSLLMFRMPEASRAKVLDILKKKAPSMGSVKMDISSKEGWTVIELLLAASPSKKDFSDVSPEFLQNRYDEISRVARKIADLLSPLLTDKGKIYRYTIFSCGSRDNVWLKTYSDMSFMYKDSKVKGGEILQTNISYLNRLLNAKGEVLVNSLKHGKVGANLYILGKVDPGDDWTFPTTMFLELNISDVSAPAVYDEGPISLADSTPYGTSSDPRKRLYETRQNYLINLMAVKSKLIDVFLLQSRYSEMMGSDIMKVKKEGQALKGDISRLQNDINEHMKRYIPRETEKKKEKNFLAKETFEKEKELLTRASVRFSLVSEVEHQIMRYSSALVVMEGLMKDAIKSLSLESHGVAIEGVPYSLGEMTIKDMERERRGLDSLMDELSHSRVILSSTIDVLRTFIDTRQREVSEDMSRLMNLLFLVFACLSLADALGNFVVMVIQAGYLSGTPSLARVYQYGSLGLIFTLLPLLIAAVFLYLYFKKR
ncbi:hypothetical protein B6U90_00320 [Thermoplasmatales archaeon ex4484_6]|nr:MAG: hypothetical protein B6U90_00320 [Thermoplasmatales archaeon ex4484_6]RLF68992.1 MAG: hypothetical protein DRN57_02245 [Thermoplasmata archaeon]